MASPISNALLRINGVQGKPLRPFEQPNEELDFWVLEISSPASDTVKLWCSRVIGTLKEHAPLLSTWRSTGSTLTLFVEFAEPEPVLRFEADFLKALSDLGIALECSKSCGDVLE